MAEEAGWQMPPEYEGEPLTDEEIEFFKRSNTKPFVECASCDEYMIDIYRQYNGDSIEDGFHSDKVDGFVCYPCRESDEQYGNTVVIFDPSAPSITKYIVYSYSDMMWSGPDNPTVEDLDETEFTPYDEERSPIQFKYVRTDGWRGYHTPKIPEGWHLFHTDCILSHSADAQELKEFDTKLRRMLWEEGITFGLCFGLTSNVFSMGYDLLVQASEDVMKTMVVIMKLQQLKSEHRDPARFSRTALTGSDEDTKEARLLVKAADMLSEGRDFEEVKEIIMAEARDA